MNTDELEDLLRKRNEASRPKAQYKLNIPVSASPRLVADKTASLDDLMEMLSGLVAKIMKKEKVEFKPDEGVRLTVDQAEKLDHPYIFFKIISCDPFKEIKPRIRECIKEDIYDKNAERPGEIYGQLFKCTVQFDILARDYKEAKAVMNMFEDVVFSYTAYLKKNGVAEILFTRRLTDRNLDVYRQKCSVRSLQYYVEIEKLFTFFEGAVSDVAVN